MICAVDARGLRTVSLFRSKIRAYSLAKDQYKLLSHYTFRGAPSDAGIATRRGGKIIPNRIKLA